MADVRYGIIGTGMMGCEHIANLRHLPGAQVVAVADPHPTSLEWARHAVGPEAPLAQFTDHRSLLDARMCDAVVIATPNHTHVDVVLDALAAGVHVLVEKPLCTTVADCQRVVDAARACRPGQVVWVGLEYRYLPPVAELLREVRSGLTGPVRMVAVREHRFPFLPKVGNWNRFNRNTGGTLVEKCCHFFDLMNLVIGARPQRVFASGGQDVNHLDEVYDDGVPDVLDNAYVVVEYAGEVRAMLDLCMFAEASRNEQEVVVVGSAGKVEALVPEGVVRVGRRADGIGQVEERPAHDERIRHLGMHHGASYVEHLEFLHAVRTGGPAAVTLEDGLWSVAVGVAAHRSIEEGRVVSLDEVLVGGAARETGAR